MELVKPNTAKTCPFCKNLSESGTHGGCTNCGKVKHNRDGFRNPRTEE
jgi:hypothetical protein